ncbi:L-aspartate oxidase [Celerinatantimonas yamalensis]|uniref:L-aspartate oxidase n=1 Tax=Celerinatantimonas yamalensis TaxID=559956 RepID=A0ABW9GC84_9GAMM
MSNQHVIVIGSGIAALSFAAHVAPECDVTLLTKKSINQSNSMLAQGGVASAWQAGDSVDQHVADTLASGAEHNEPERVKAIIAEGQTIIRQLLLAGCPFDKTRSGEPSLGKEGAHNFNRIFHAGGDQTGKVLVQFLSHQLGPNIRRREQTQVIDLIKNADNSRCIGVLLKNEHGQLETLRADAVVLATGGCGQLYSVTTNDPSLTGDGLMMAYRAGAKLVDLEFTQFHPTLLIHQQHVFGLVSEAVRGQGAFLEDEHGRRIMTHIHPLQDLAPRDIVARAMYNEQQQGHSIYLNIKPVSHFRALFPTITQLCQRAGVQLEEGRIPVAPGMHFLMGGIYIDETGQCDVPGLYAIGEVACSGLHGANRLASNSLLEGLVYGRRVALALSKQPLSQQGGDEPLTPTLTTTIQVPQISMSQLREQIWSALAIERNGAQLSKFFAQLAALPYQEVLIQDADEQAIEKSNCWALAKLMSQSALQRQESRGSHYRNDYPKPDPKWQGKQLIHQYGKLSIIHNPRITRICTCCH